MATTTKHTTMLDIVALLIAGLTNSPPAVAKSLLVQGKSLTVAQIITALTVIQTLLQAVVSAKGVWSKAVAAAKAQSVTNHAFLAALRTALIQAYGADVEGLKACGIVVKPKVRRTSQQNAVAAARAKDTRKANGTGKKAAAAPTVTVTDTDGTVIGASDSASVAAPAAPAAPATNAAPAVAPAAVPSGK